MRTRYLPALALFVCVWLGSPAVALGDSPIGAWSWFGTNPSSISVSYNCTTTVPNPDGSPYKVTTSAWATIADSSGTVVARYTSPVVVGSGTINFTLTYDIPKAEQVVYWPWDQPLPSARPGVLTFVGTLHTHADEIDGSVRDGEDQHTFTIYPRVVVTTPPPTPRPTRQPTPRPTPPPTATPSPEPTDAATPEPSSNGTPIPTASPTSRPSLSPAVSGSADPTTIAAAVESTGSAGKGGGDQWIILPLVALIGVASVLFYWARFRRPATPDTHE